MTADPWDERRERERPLIERVLERAPSKRVIDLGCGSGGHARLLAELGCEVVAIDVSEQAIDRAQEEPVPETVQFILADMGAVERSVRGQFGAAFCLGNTIPHLLTAESVSRMLIGLRRRLLAQAPLVLHLVNYQRVFHRGSEALPLEVRPAAEGERILVQLVRPREDRIVTHTSATLIHRPTTQPVMELVDSQRIQVRGWTLEELETLLDVARFSILETHGDMEESPYDPERSPELVVIAG